MQTNSSSLLRSAKFKSIFCSGYAVLFLLFLLHAITRQWLLPVPQTQLTQLPAAPSLTFSKVLGLGDAAWASQLLNLYVQAHDMQAGKGLVLKQLNHAGTLQWLKLLRQLDPHNPSAVFMATHVYLEVAPQAAQRTYLQWIASEFQKQPGQTWRFMAHAIWLTRHKLQDRALALQMAQELRQFAPMAPVWAQQMEVFILEEAGEYESAAAILVLMLRDQPQLKAEEQQFLLNKLLALKGLRTKRNQSRRDKRN